MTILTRYVAREFSKNFFLSLGAFSTIYLVVEFFERINAFLVNHASLLMMAAYFANKIPFILFQVAPSSILLSCIVTLGIMSKNNEIMALKSGGIPLSRISLPILGVVMILYFALLGMNEFIIHSTNQNANQIRDFIIDKKKPTAHYKESQLWIHGQQAFYNIQVYRPAQELLEGITIFRFDKDFNLTQRVDARSARWKEGRWRFAEASVTQFGPDGSPSRKYYPEISLFFPETPRDLQIAEKNPEEMNFRELWNYVGKIEQGGYNASKYRCAMHATLSFPFIGVIMALLGIPLGLRKERGAGMALGVGFSILISFAYLVVFSFSLELGKAETLLPVLAAWMGNIIFALVGIFLFLSVRH
ncbi:MAG: LPS export ABC transporter permease LptG [Deltaproteobacteria bacterium]|nr:LPS export ABC transporter permease LptG [Deltaproteobacteria bacterium]